MSNFIAFELLKVSVKNSFLFSFFLNLKGWSKILKMRKKSLETLSSSLMRWIYWSKVQIMKKGDETLLTRKSLDFFLKKRRWKKERNFCRKKIFGKILEKNFLFSKFKKFRFNSEKFDFFAFLSIFFLDDFFLKKISEISFKKYFLKRRGKKLSAHSSFLSSFILILGARRTQIKLFQLWLKFLSAV